MEKKKHQRLSISLETKIAILDRLGKGEGCCISRSMWNPLVSPLETETLSHTTPAKLHSFSTENLAESVPNESNSEHSTAAEAQKIVKRKSRNRRKRPKQCTRRTDVEKPLLINKCLRPRALKGDRFNTFSHDDIDELLVDDALSDNYIIDLILDLTVDGVVGLEGDNDEEENSTPLIGKLIQEGLQLCSKLENHFLINDPNSE
ncbi:hypothetical protein TNCV_814441 [Trichonephila clavipes]|nr:hypothetical protein TNCV_814441 [Trichonephila clavipes]